MKDFFPITPPINSLIDEKFSSFEISLIGECPRQNEYQQRRATESESGESFENIERTSETWGTNRNNSESSENERAYSRTSASQGASVGHGARNQRAENSRENNQRANTQRANTQGNGGNKSKKRKGKFSIFGRPQRSSDGRREVDQNSLAWWGRSILSTLTFGLVRPPKTRRTYDYGAQFKKHNPGVFSDGFYFCAYCGRPCVSSVWKQKHPHRKRAFFRRIEDMEVDHVRPVNKGGRNSTWNLVAACHTCNRRKSDKTGLWIPLGRIGKVVSLGTGLVSNLVTGIIRHPNPIWKVLSGAAWLGFLYFGTPILLGGAISLLHLSS